ncbi:MAG: DUF2207 domain-containing protein [Bacteroidia bacterium]|nr:DUF2207 domain-containing protein [Bacteroidia bacterium]
MKNLKICFLSLIFLLPLGLRATYFEVNDYFVSLVVGADGSLDVTETITVNFTENRHGIIREIPYSYNTVPVIGEKAEGHYDGTPYTTYYDEITVDNYDFSISREGGKIKLKIGSPNAWVNGEKVYKIHYKIYGVINFFSDRAELYWNLTGNAWTERINKVRWEVKLPDQPTNYFVWTGIAGSTQSHASLKTTQNGVSGETTSPILPQEGVTVAVSIPRTHIRNEPVPPMVLADRYVVNDLHCKLKVHEDGKLEVWQNLEVDFKQTENSFVHSFPYAPAGQQGAPPEWAFEYQILDISLPGVYSRGSGYRSFTQNLLFSASDPPHQFTYHYYVYNCFQEREGNWELDWKVLGEYLNEPCQKASFEIEFPAGYLAKNHPPTFLRNNFETPDLKTTLGEDHFSGETRRTLVPHDEIAFFLQLDGSKFTPAKLPIKLLTDEFYADTQQVSLTFHKNGWIDFDYYYNVTILNHYQNLNAGYTKEVYVFDYERPGEAEIWRDELPSHQIFGRDKKWLTCDFQSDPPPSYSYSSPYANEFYWSFENQKLKSQQRSWSYRANGLVGEMEGKDFFHFPINRGLDGPSQVVRVKINLEDGLKNLENILMVCNNYSLLYEVPLKKEGNALVAELPNGLREGEFLQLALSFPQGSISPAIGTRLRLFYLNNPWLIWPFAAPVVCFLVWLLFGREKKFTEMVRFHPPDGCTPAEAGYLADFKVHNQDIISMIYFWAANGNLKMVDEGLDPLKKSVSLVKNKTPIGMKKFEKTIWNKLFSGQRKKVKLSQLKNTFYGTLALSKTQLTTQFQNEKQFYRPSLVMGTILRTFGILVGIGAIGQSLLVILGQGFHQTSRWDMAIGLWVMTLSLYLTGRKIPRRSNHGAETWSQLKGFREFIEKAEQDRLKQLVDEDPNYFGQTLPYAIAFGLASPWVAKFKDLLITSPDWYVSNDTRGFTTTLFATDLDRNLIQMERTFKSTPPAPSGGSSYSSSGSSYSSSSYSSSSFGSSGGSFSSGGSSSGYSGGGYGGGGGSSW